MDWMTTAEAEDFHDRLYREHLSEIVFLEEHCEGLKNDPAMEKAQIDEYRNRLRAHSRAFNSGGEKAVKAVAKLLDEEEEGDIWAEEKLYLAAMRVIGGVNPEILCKKFKGSSEPLLPYFVEFLKKWDLPDLNDQILAVFEEESGKSASPQREENSEDYEEDEDDEWETTLREACADILRFRAPELLPPQLRTEERNA